MLAKALTAALLQAPPHPLSSFPLRRHTPNLSNHTRPRVPSAARRNGLLACASVWGALWCLLDWVGFASVTETPNMPVR